MPSLRELGEFELLRRLAAARVAPAGTVVDAGDDAAVLRPSPGRELVYHHFAFVAGHHHVRASRRGRARAGGARNPERPGRDGPRAPLGRSRHGCPRRSRRRRADPAADRRRGGLGAGRRTGRRQSRRGRAPVVQLRSAGRAGTTGPVAALRPGDLSRHHRLPGRAAAGSSSTAGSPTADAEDLAAVLDAWRAPANRIRLAHAGAGGGVAAAIDISDGFARRPRPPAKRRRQRRITQKAARGSTAGARGGTTKGHPILRFGPATTTSCAGAGSRSARSRGSARGRPLHRDAGSHCAAGTAASAAPAGRVRGLDGGQ